ncbi:gamma-secretase subunit APH-1A isoform X2 [Corvus kubaryi]|uniref:gamma-secretase subunit APH-1A isoform X2 n=1 Tax=Corvus kubaryi TaxID=68294 RepID=UPI001C055928|nr:gamma-secretase subunit APH-1A isoform X2 [Corvus kubaryi]
MGAAAFFGCAAIAFGPAAALVLLTVAAEPLRVLVLVAGAFFWLLSLLAASLLWFVSVQLSGREDAALLLLGAAAAVLLQELCRFACFKLLKKADEGLATLSEDGRSPISLRQMAYVSGLSFGIISGIFSIVNILADDSSGPGTVGIHGDSPYYFITSAFLTMALVLFHTFWGVIFFDACERRHAGGLGLVVGGHLLASGLVSPGGPRAGGDLPEPVVRGQPGPHLHPHALHRPLGLPHCWRLLPQHPQVPLL